MSRIRYRFSHRAGGFYYWLSASRVDSRHVQVSCPVDWFWNPTTTPRCGHDICACGETGGHGGIVRDPLAYTCPLP